MSWFEDIFDLSELADKLQAYLWSWVNDIAEYWARLCYGFRKSLWDVKVDLWDWADDIAKYWVARANQWWSILNYTYDELEDTWEDAVDRAKYFLEEDIITLWRYLDSAYSDIDRWLEAQEDLVKGWILGTFNTLEDWLDTQEEYVRSWVLGAYATVEDYVVDRFEAIIDRVFE